MNPQITAALRQFVDDELMRLPMVADQVFDSAWRDMQHGVPALGAHDRAVVGELLQVSPAHRARLVDRFVESMREQVHKRLGGGASTQNMPSLNSRAGPLALMDENEVANDVEISHAMQAILSTAEHELRELASYISTLAGDPDVSRDYNPFTANCYARALWDAVQMLPMGSGYQARLMRLVSTPMAQVLRKVFAGACARLDSQGIEPASHRTIILPGGKRTARASESWLGQAPTLHEVRATMPVPAGPDMAPRTSQVPLDHLIHDAAAAMEALPHDATPTVRAQLMNAQRARLVRHASSPVDQQLIEMLSRLFEAMQSDDRVPRDVRSLLARVQPSALRLVLRDDTALDDYTHPVWRFMDLTAHLAGVYGEGSPERNAVLSLADVLIDEVTHESVPDDRVYRRGLDRLIAADKGRFEARVRRAAADIEAMQRIEDQLAADTQAGVITGMGPLDEAQLETIPADLLDSLPEPGADQLESAEWVAQRRPGEWLRLFVHGEWQRAQLLCIGHHGDAFLLGRNESDDTIALRRRALMRLHDEGLLKQMRMRSVLRSAAVKVLHLTQAG